MPPTAADRLSRLRRAASPSAPWLVILPGGAGVNPWCEREGARPAADLQIVAPDGIGRVERGQPLVELGARERVRECLAVTAELLGDTSQGGQREGQIALPVRVA